MKLVIIDYGAGNIQSIKFAFERLGYQAVLSDNAVEIAAADKVIFPGVGAAASAMEKLKASKLHKLIPELTQPVLGICLGMQLMCTYSEEGNTQGLSIFDVPVKRFNEGQKVPQIGWNKIEQLRSPLFKEIDEGAYIYMVHSYYAPLCDQTIATSEYGLAYSAALQRDNFYGVQFHPEKSSVEGEIILKNFLAL
ncbi:imidazole glycerol phosphate synthase subunit HisH [Zeaxanthinibacter sp. PT1]|uniref:imidazole glycerol phosphate synthase subunit HisH n=1 Tax=Zeaxanthinibacter TaxID=561554 RepID=UPI00234B5EC1|nr:imidazole glycerol phosphate synthase subunit HisH [Zeaxanthinibacter sp. PT1]MDC6351559.1 imidazole glycerol phosphate synthase subunit HisH [Zeaxanthinibacter sp. PT1]